MSDNISEYDPSCHILLLSNKGLKVGDRLGNRFVGECWVDRIWDYKIDEEGADWITVRYEGILYATNERKFFTRADPLSIDGGIPYFWKLKE